MFPRRQSFRIHLFQPKLALLRARQRRSPILRHLEFHWRHLLYHRSRQIHHRHLTTPSPHVLGSQAWILTCQSEQWKLACPRPLTHLLLLAHQRKLPSLRPTFLPHLYHCCLQNHRIRRLISLAQHLVLAKLGLHFELLGLVSHLECLRLHSREQVRQRMLPIRHHLVFRSNHLLHRRSRQTHHLQVSLIFLLSSGPIDQGLTSQVSLRQLKRPQLLVHLSLLGLQR